MWHQTITFQARLLQQMPYLARSSTTTADHKVMPLSKQKIRPPLAKAIVPQNHAADATHQSVQKQT